MCGILLFEKIVFIKNYRYRQINILFIYKKIKREEILRKIYIEKE